MQYRKVPKIDRKTGQQNGWRWIFYRYNPEKKRNDKVPKSAIPPHIWKSTNEKEVAEYCQSQAALDDTIKDRARRRHLWISKYYNFQDLLEEFSECHKVKAPNSWENDVHYLKNYVFVFFLGTIDANNVNTWNILYPIFKAWLGDVKPLKKNILKLSLNSQNKVINSLNRFTRYLIEVGKCEMIPIMTFHERHKLPEVTVQDLFREDEIITIFKALENIRPISAHIFMVLVRSGLRVNEALGINLKSVYSGKIAGGIYADKLHKALESYSIGDYFGYINLEIQPMLDEVRCSEDFVDRNGKKWKRGSVPRKPLKCRKKIEPKSNRTIPIYDKTTWNILARLWNEQVGRYEKNEYGDNRDDYLLFNDITSSMFYSDMMKAFEVTGLRKRSPHKCRHTFLTWFYSEILENMFIAEKVGGHRDKKSLEVYSHMHEVLGRELELQIAQQNRISYVE